MSHKKDTKSTLGSQPKRVDMTAEEFWARLRAWGYTKRQVIEAGGRRRVMLNAPDGSMPFIDHPEDFSFDQRAAILSTFAKHNRI